MSVMKRTRIDKQGRTVASYVARVYHPGLRKQVCSPTFSRKVDADSWDADMKRKVKMRQSIDVPEDITIERLAQMYLASLELERTRRKRQNGVDKWVKYFGKNKIVSHITRSDVKGFAASLKAAGLKPSSVSTYMATLKAALAIALEDDLIKTNPAAGRLDRSSSARAGVSKKGLTHQEHERLLDAIPERHRAMFYVWPRCGLRIGEMRALTWEHVDLDAGEFHVVQQYQGGTGFCDPKCGSSGTVLVSRSVVSALRQWKLQSRKIPNPLGLVFPADRGGVLDDDYITRNLLKTAAVSVGLDWVTPHTMRHTFGSWLMDGGVGNFAFIQKQMRHATLKQTLECYLHDTSEDGAELAECVESRRAVNRA